jgi:hypothetical protein
VKILANVVCGLAILTGIVWVLQGANLLGGSFMSGRPQWLYIGLALIVGGATALWWVNLGSSRS